MMFSFANVLLTWGMCKHRCKVNAKIDMWITAEVHARNVNGNMDRRLDDVEVHTQMFSFVNVLLTQGECACVNVKSMQK